MKIVDLNQLQKMMNNASRDGFKQLVQHIKAQEKEIETLQEVIRELRFEKDNSTHIDAKILKKLLKKRDDDV